MEHVVRVETPGSGYDVVISRGGLDQFGSYISRLNLNSAVCAVITDSNVGPLYAERVTSALIRVGIKPLTLEVAAGEHAKCIAEAGRLCEKMAEAGLDRSSFVVALGGGVVGDLAGFVASIFQRGVPVVQVPTTVVSQVDSAVGGKTGVNLNAGKNLVGTFHQPVCVIADPETLTTLPEREFNEGFAEIIKHGAIRDTSLIDVGSEDLADIVLRNVAIKADIVRRDPLEKLGLRAFLNFGHTIGHGIENAAGYGRLLHGEAISLGLVAACRLSMKHGGLPAEHAKRIIAALESRKLPTVLPDDISTENVLSAMRRDKKFRAGAIRFVLLRTIGDPFICETLGETDLIAEIERLREK